MRSPPSPPEQITVAAVDLNDCRTTWTLLRWPKTGLWPSLPSDSPPPRPAHHLPFRPRLAYGEVLPRRTPMASVFPFLLAIALWAFPTWSAFAIAAPAPRPLGAIPGLSAVFAGDPPELGIQDGKLSPCPATPNCVVSQGADPDHAIAAIVYTGSRDEAREVLAKVLGVVPRTEIVTQREDYTRVKSTSRIMGFVDDTEFYFPEDEPVIHVRAAARLGESDLGVNRRRLEQIRFALRDLGI